MQANRQLGNHLNNDSNVKMLFVLKYEKCFVFLLKPSENHFSLKTLINYDLMWHRKNYTIFPICIRKKTFFSTYFERNFHFYLNTIGVDIIRFIQKRVCTILNIVYIQTFKPKPNRKTLFITHFNLYLNIQMKCLISGIHTMVCVHKYIQRYKHKLIFKMNWPIWKDKNDKYKMHASLPEIIMMMMLMLMTTMDVCWRTQHSVDVNVTFCRCDYYLALFLSTANGRLVYFFQHHLFHHESR